MNIKHIVASVSLLIAAGAAMAAPAELNFPSAAVQGSTVSRDQVKAEIFSARAVGDLELSEASVGQQRLSPSTRSGFDVRAEVVAARAAGLLDLNETNFPLINDLSRRGFVTATLQSTGQ